VDEARLRAVRQLRAHAAAGVPRRGHPAEQRLQLAAVADAEAEGVWPVVELLELLEHALVEADRGGPALGRVQHISIGEATWGDKTDTSRVTAYRCQHLQQTVQFRQAWRWVQTAGMMRSKACCMLG
jgi:hypothetical protein